MLCEQSPGQANHLHMLEQVNLRMHMSPVTLRPSDSRTKDIARPYKHHDVCVCVCCFVILCSDLIYYMHTVASGHVAACCP